MAPQTSQQRCPLLEPCEIKIMVVPVGPIKADTFNRVVDVLRTKCTSVKVGDLTPDSKTAKFTEQFYHNGYLHYSFQTSYNREWIPLEEMQLYRQIFAVIGILDCQQLDDLSEGYKSFQSISQKFPTALSFRCFGFNPRPSQTDNIKGLVLIPDVGDVSFYLQTMVNDLTSDILLAFGSLAGQIERRSLISGPNLPLLSGIQSSAISQMNMAGPVVPEETTELSGVRDDQLVQSSNLPHGGMGSVGPSSSNIPFGIGNILASDRTKKRTPARAQKLLGDLYLLCGRLELAIASYSAAIESMKHSNDTLWQGSAMEGLICTRILQYYFAGMNDDEQDDEHKLTLRLPSSHDIIAYSLTLGKDLKPFILELGEKYRDLLGLYERGSQPRSSPILQIQACLKMAAFIADIFMGPALLNLSGGCHVSYWTIEFKTITELASRIGASATSTTLGNTPAQTASASSTAPDRVLPPNAIGFGKSDTLSWLMRAWSYGVESMSPSDQIWISASIARIAGYIGAKRKQLFFLRKSYLAAVSHSTSSSTPEKDVGLELLRVQTRTLSLYDSLYRLNEEIEFDPSSKLFYGWPGIHVQLYKDYLVSAEKLKLSKQIWKSSSDVLRHFHTVLSRKEQIYFLKKMRDIVLNDKLLAEEIASMNNNLTENDRADILSTGLQAPVITSMELIWPPQSQVVAAHSASELLAEAKESVGSNRPVFIYNPFASNKTAETKKAPIWMVGVMCYVDVVLSNPYTFDLEIDQLNIWTSGVQFKSLPVSTRIPAEAKSHQVRLSGIPLSSGSLVMQGCSVSMFNGVVKDLIPFSSSAHTNRTLIRESWRVGKNELEFVSPPKDQTEKTSKVKKESSTKSCSVDIVKEQPVLELARTNVDASGTIMLFSGETTELCITLRNSGQVPLNFLKVFVNEENTTTLEDSYVGKLLSQTRDYERNVFLNATRGFWIERPEKGNGNRNVAIPFNRPISHRYPCELASGEEIEITIGVFGKPTCVGASILIEYGVLEQDNWEGRGQFYTRQLKIPVLLTVTKGLIVEHLDILTCGEEDVLCTFESGQENGVQSNETAIPNLDDSFLLTFDMTNVWNEPFDVMFQVKDNPRDVKTVIHAGATHRIILPIKKFLLSQSLLSSPIPEPEGKQFVVSKTEESLSELERILFWFRHALIGGVSEQGIVNGSWICSSRTGALLLRSLHLNAPKIHILRVNDTIVLPESVCKAETGETLTASGRTFAIPLKKFIKITWKVTNNKDTNVRLFFRVLPVVENGSKLEFVDSDVVTVLGSKQSVIGPLAPKESRRLEFLCLAHVACRLRFLTHVEDVRRDAPISTLAKASKVKSKLKTSSNIDRLIVDCIHWDKSSMEFVINLEQ